MPTVEWLVIGSSTVLEPIRQKPIGGTDLVKTDCTKGFVGAEHGAMAVDHCGVGHGVGCATGAVVVVCRMRLTNQAATARARGELK